MNKHLKLLTDAFLFVSAGTFVFIFFQAYFSPTKTTLVDINYYGEANIELIVMIILMVLFIVRYFEGVDEDAKN